MRSNSMCIRSPNHTCAALLFLVLLLTLFGSHSSLAATRQPCNLLFLFLLNPLLNIPDIVFNSSFSSDNLIKSHLVSHLDVIIGVQELFPKPVISSIWYQKVIRKMIICEVPNQIPIYVFIVLPQHLRTDLLRISIRFVQLQSLLYVLPQLHRVD
jgi:hypothetical protein